MVRAWAAGPEACKAFVQTRSTQIQPNLVTNAYPSNTASRDYLNVRRLGGCADAMVGRKRIAHDAILHPKWQTKEAPVM